LYIGKQSFFYFSDLKPENILLESREKNAIIKIIDFGTSRKIEIGEKLTKRLGTVTFFF
jgi:calcium-dependent protein kinase